MVALSNVRFDKRNDEAEAIPTALTRSRNENPRRRHPRVSRRADEIGLRGLAAHAGTHRPGCRWTPRLLLTGRTRCESRVGRGLPPSRGHHREFRALLENSGVSIDEATARAFAEQAMRQDPCTEELGHGVGDGANILTLIFRGSSFKLNAVNRDDINATGPVQPDRAKRNGPTARAATPR